MQNRDDTDSARAREPEPEHRHETESIVYEALQIKRFWIMHRKTCYYTYLTGSVIQIRCKNQIYLKKTILHKKSIS